MSQEELVDRLLIGQADVDAWKLKTGRLAETDFSKLSTAMGELADAPIFIDATKTNTLGQFSMSGFDDADAGNYQAVCVDPNAGYAAQIKDSLTSV